MLFFDENLGSEYAHTAIEHTKPPQAFVSCSDLGYGLRDCTIVSKLLSQYPTDKFLIFTHDKSFIDESNTVIRRSKFGIIEISEPSKIWRTYLIRSLEGLLSSRLFDDLICRKIRVTHFGFIELNWR